MKNYTNLSSACIVVTLLSLTWTIFEVPKAQCFNFPTFKKVPLRTTLFDSTETKPSETLLNMHKQQMDSNSKLDRRSSFKYVVSNAVLLSFWISSSPPADAAVDCFKDCFKNCKILAPKDPAYCTDNCKDYCDQPDREDGLSGSISSAKGETGILGTNTVVKGEDKPPSFNLPGLDFSSDKGKKLIGY